MSTINRIQLMQPRAFSLSSRSLTTLTILQFLPIHGSFSQIIKINSRYRRMLISNRFLRIISPIISSRNPKPMSKSNRLKIIIRKSPTRCSKKRIHRRFINNRTFLMAFTLNRPIITVHRFCHQVNTSVLSTKVLLCGKLIPKPNI